MEIKAADVAKLRKMTGAGMMDCKKALIEAEEIMPRLRTSFARKENWSQQNVPTVQQAKA